jgi:hypothetical protein
MNAGDFMAKILTQNLNDRSCVPDGIHTTVDIDWSKVEGAEYMLWVFQAGTAFIHHWHPC